MQDLSAEGFHDNTFTCHDCNDQYRFGKKQDECADTNGKLMIMSATVQIRTADLVMVPEPEDHNPAMARSTEVLPTPLGPITSSDSPSFTYMGQALSAISADLNL